MRTAGAGRGCSVWLKSAQKCSFLALLSAPCVSSAPGKQSQQPPAEFGVFCPTATGKEGMLEGIIKRAHREDFLVINSPQC